MTTTQRILLFKPKFIEPVRAGTKLQTIRPTRRFPITVGDKLSLRHWKDRPYASPQVLIREAHCTRTGPVRISHDWVVVDHRLLTAPEIIEFAKADGFEHPQQMIEEFATMHGLPFSGVLIQWGANV